MIPTLILEEETYNIASIFWDYKTGEIRHVCYYINSERNVNTIFKGKYELEEMIRWEQI